MNAPDLPPGAAQPVHAPAHDGRSDALELVISDLLRWGVIAAVGVIALGMGLTFFHHPDYFLSAEALQRLTSPAQGPHSVEEVIAGLHLVQGASVEMAGLLLLIALPVTRVAFSVVVFFVRRDRKYVWLSGIVLVLLLTSFLLGRAE